VTTIEISRTDIAFLAYNLVREMASEAASRAGTASDMIAHLPVYGTIESMFGEKVSSAAAYLIAAVDIVEAQQEKTR
jgi:hypothetical protein